MTPKVNIIVILLLLAFVAAALKRTDNRTSLGFNHLNGKVRSQQHIDSMLKYDATGVHIKLFIKTIDEYDTNGHLTRYVSYLPNGDINFTTSYKYNDSGLVSSTVHSKPDGSFIITHHAYKYDKRGNAIEHTIINDSTGVQSTVYSEYDDNGNLIKNYSYDKNGKQRISFNVKYDDNKHLIWKDANSTPPRTYSYKYDEKGDQIEEDEIDQFGNASSSNVYLYDSTHRKIMAFFYLKNEFVKRDIYTYNKMGMIDTIRTLESNNVVDVSINHITYDTCGNWIFYNTYDNDTLTYVRKRLIEYY